MRREDYPVTFTDAQWERLQQAFPGGVCDYTKPGVSQHGALSWLTYQTRRGRVSTAESRSGSAPRSHRIR